MLPDGVRLFNPNNAVDSAIERVFTPLKFRRSNRIILETDSLANYFRRQLDVGDFVATVYGPKNIGKSESTIELCHQICPEFNLDEDVVFTLGAFYDVMENGREKKWRVKILDDFGSELDPTEGMFDPARHTSQYFQTSRTFNTGYFITTPNKKFINKDTRDRIADYYIEIKKKNVKGRFTTGVVHWIQQNNRLERFYNHSLHLGPNGLVNNRDYGDKIWEWTFYPPPKHISDHYKPLREQKGIDNLERGAADFKKVSDNDKSEEELAREVLGNITKYARKTVKGKVIFNKGLIAYEKNLGSKRMPKVMALIEELISNDDIAKIHMPFIPVEKLGKEDSPEEDRK
jgi:hypothetical protein